VSYAGQVFVVCPARCRWQRKVCAWLEGVRSVLPDGYMVLCSRLGHIGRCITWSPMGSNARWPPVNSDRPQLFAYALHIGHRMNLRSASNWSIFILRILAIAFRIKVCGHVPWPHSGKQRWQWWISFGRFADIWITGPSAVLDGCGQLRTNDSADYRSGKSKDAGCVSVMAASVHGHYFVVTLGINSIRYQFQCQ